MAGRSYVDFAMEQPALYEIIYVPRTILEAREPHDPLEVGEQACAIGQFWSDRVREMMDAGYLEVNDPHRVSMTLWAHGHGMISIYHRGLLGVDTEEEFRTHMTESFVRLLVGLGTARIGEVTEKLQEIRGREAVGA